MARMKRHSERSERWAAGAKLRNDLRRLCRERGVCTKCFGRGSWWSRGGHQECNLCGGHINPDRPKVRDVRGAA